MEQVGIASTDPLGTDLASLVQKFHGMVIQELIRKRKQMTLDAWVMKATMTKGKEKEV
jgi:hypothetical protein